MNKAMWFRARRYGYGPGLPLTWHGWGMIISYILILAVIGFLDKFGAGQEGANWARVLAFALFVPSTTCFMIICARRTKGGWKWRWGEKG
jgi:heme/copper-type cytochrome/quinol oxidase subunit 1